MFKVGDKVSWKGYGARVYEVRDRRRNGGTVTYGIIYGGDGSTWVQEEELEAI